MIEHEGKRIPIKVVDVVGNGEKKRPPNRPEIEKTGNHVEFHPAQALRDDAGKKEDTDGNNV